MEGTIRFGLLFASLLLNLVAASLYCKGYDITVHYIRNCGSANVIQLQNIKATVDDYCNIIPTGCVNIVKTVKTAKAHYKLKRGSKPPTKGDVDLCEVTEYNAIPEVGLMLAIFGVAGHCPLKAAKVCNGGGNSIDISKYEKQLGMVVGNTELKLDVTHDGGGKSCIEVGFNVKSRHYSYNV